MPPKQAERSARALRLGFALLNVVPWIWRIILLIEPKTVWRGVLAPRRLRVPEFRVEHCIFQRIFRGAHRFAFDRLEFYVLLYIINMHVCTCILLAFIFDASAVPIPKWPTMHFIP